MTDEVVTRLYRALVEELRRRDHPEDQPVTVSELHQTLIPYAAVRSAIGVELNADYEHALLRLLAGERGLLRLEPRTAREELRREVEAPYPFVGLFRKFSGSEVWVTMTEPAKDSEAAQRTEAAQTEEAAPAAELEPEPAVELEPVERGVPSAPSTPAPAASSEGGDRPRSPGLAAETETARMRSGGAEPAPERPPIHLHPSRPKPTQQQPLHTPASCGFCGEDLPAGRRVRFCPYCGGDQRLRPCPRCEAVLERDWRHCISCGHEVGTS